MTYKTHGMDGTSIYRAWMSMKARCYNPNDKDYHHYGGRGIKVCDRWLKFENFYADMGDKPENTSLDRIDVNGNYEPGNCRWATQRVQRINRRHANSTGIMGVNKERNKFRVRIKANDKYLHIGMFETLNEAVTARKQAERKYWDASYDT